MVRAIQEGLATKYGCLATVEHGRPTASRGTVAFVASGPERYLMTANHVVEGLWKRSELLYVLRAHAPSEASIPEEHAIDRSALKWSSADLDVALLRAPTSLVDAPGIGWFDSERGRDQLTRLRAKWDASAAPHLTLAAGFPNFGRLGGPLTEELSGELLGMLTLPAGIVLLGKTRDSRQMILELLHDDPILFEDAGALTRATYEVLKASPPARSEDLGGISGGPLVVPRLPGRLN